MNERELITDALNNEDVGLLCDFLFGVELTPEQEKIVHNISFGVSKRLVISCMTRFGKSYCVGFAILLYILGNRDKRVILIAPTIKQTMIIRNYISQAIIKSPVIQGLIDIQATGIDRLKTEVSKTRITFKNGCELLTLSAEGSGERLMGFGGELIICDEDCLIGYETYRSKISRMLGDNPDSTLVSIGNPWHRNNQMYQHWTDPSFTKIHINYEIALTEKRITKEFLEEQRMLLLPLEFEVLYKANFPEESADSIFKLSEVNDAEQKKFSWKNTPVESKRIISCDVSDKGLDRTVIMIGLEINGCYIIERIFSEPKSDNMGIVAKILQFHREKKADVINVDTIGVGAGVVSRLKEVLQGEKVRVNPCHFGEGVSVIPGTEFRADTGRKRFLNKKAEQYFRLKDLFSQGKISIPQHLKLKQELMNMRWDMTSSERIKIIDPETHSPDYADALVYFVWKDKSEVIYSFSRG